MTDYTELLELLRYCSSKSGCIGCKLSEAYDCTADLTRDAAAAIEALQAQLPKRGKWILSKERMRPDMCSVCGCVYEADRFMDKIAWNYCPNCGARMDGERREA